MDTYINPHTISSVCESQKRLLSKGESKNEHFSFIVIGSFSVWIDKHIHMPKNYKSKKGFTVKILSPNFHPLMPTQCCFPRVNQCHWFLLDPSRDGLCWYKYTSVFLVLCFSFLLCEDLSWIFKYKSSREGDLDNGRKNVAMEGKRKPVGPKTQIRYMGQALPCCGNFKCEAGRRGTQIMAKSDCHAAGHRFNLVGSRTPKKTFNYKSNMC